MTKEIQEQSRSLPNAPSSFLLTSLKLWSPRRASHKLTPQIHLFLDLCINIINMPPKKDKKQDKKQDVKQDKKEGTKQGKEEDMKQEEKQDEKQDKAGAGASIDPGRSLRFTPTQAN